MISSSHGFAFFSQLSFFLDTVFSSRHSRITLLVFHVTFLLFYIVSLVFVTRFHISYSRFFFTFYLCQKVLFSPPIRAMIYDPTPYAHSFSLISSFELLPSLSVLGTRYTSASWHTCHLFVNISYSSFIIILFLFYTTAYLLLISLLTLISRR